MDPSKEPAVGSEHEALKKKVAELEATITRAKYIGAAVSVAVGVLLGVGILQAPAAIGKIVDGYVKEEAKTRIEVLLAAETESWLKGPLRENILKTAAEAVPSALKEELSQRGIKPTTVVGNAQRGCVVAGAMQYCWGTLVAVQPPDNMHIRQFTATFAREFVSQPTVTTSVLANSDGTTYTLYDFDRTTRGLSGSVASNRMGQYSTTSFKVQIAYFAVAPTTRDPIALDRP
jgi:hypothetical protein